MPKKKYTLEQKSYVRDLKKKGKQAQEITQLFMETYGVEVKPSTLATWYTPSNMETHEQRGHTNTSMASVETHYNPRQRPTIMLDLDCALLHQIKESNNSGTVTTRTTIRKWGQSLFNTLRAWTIYEDSGMRLQPLTKVSLLDRIRDFHVTDAELPPPPPRGDGNVFTFNASYGWAKNFEKRHNIHTEKTQASPSAAADMEDESMEDEPSAASASPSAAADMEDESMEDEPSTAAVFHSSTIGTINTLTYKEGDVEWNLCKFTSLN